MLQQVDNFTEQEKAFKKKVDALEQERLQAEIKVMIGFEPEKKKKIRKRSNGELISESSSKQSSDVTPKLGGGL